VPDLPELMLVWRFDEEDRVWISSYEKELKNGRRERDGRSERETRRLEKTVGRSDVEA
jgi:hypothetical protein